MRRLDDAANVRFLPGDQVRIHEGGVIRPVDLSDAIQVVGASQRIERPDRIVVRVAEQGELDHNVALRGQPHEAIQPAEELVVPLVEVETRLPIHCQIGPSAWPLGDVVGRLDFQRRVRIPRCLQLAEQQEQARERLAARGGFVEITGKVEGAVDHRTVVLGGANQYKWTTAKQEQFSVLRMDAEWLSLWRRTPRGYVDRVERRRGPHPNDQTTRP